MSDPIQKTSLPRNVRRNTRSVTGEKRKPNIPGRWIYVGDFVGPDDPGNDPPGATYNSPSWMNDFYYTSPVAFRHGLDGQTDMIGQYDLTLGAVSGTTAFLMPLQWALNAPPAAHFPVELEPDVWTIAVQTIDVVNLVSGKAPVKIFWPIVADPVP